MHKMANLGNGGMGKTDEETAAAVTEEKSVANGVMAYGFDPTADSSNFLERVRRAASYEKELLCASELRHLYETMK